jgi:hypothetical protein
MPNPIDESENQEWLFENGPPLALQRRLGFVREKQLNVRRRAVGVIAIGWVPLIVLAIASDILFQTHSAPSLLHDAGFHARYLLAAPLLILAESDCGTRLSAIIMNFIDAGLVRDHQRARFEALVHSTRDLIGSRIAEAAVIGFAIVTVVAAAASFPAGKLPAWHKYGETFSFSLAGWWHVLVSLPLLIILMFGWVWRFVLWARLLWQIARLDLHLIASHPDRSAGLCFLGQSLRAFAPVALAITIIAAGRSANVVLAGGGLPTPNIVFNASLVVALVAVLTAPLLVFGQNLFNVWCDATFRYGALATKVGALFEEKWLRDSPTDQSTVLEKPDFSATTDLYGIVANVYALRFIPADLNSAVALVSAVLLPFVPVVLLAVPAETIWADFKSLFF